MIEAHATQPMLPALRHAIGVSFSGCLMGITIAYSASACEDMANDYYLKPPTLTQATLFAALPPLVALFTGILLSRLQNWLGKKIMIALSALLNFIGYTMIAYNKEYKLLFAGRLITGMGLGVTCIALSPYISEISPTKQRGAFTTIMQIQIQGGVLLISILGLLPITFRWNAIIAASIAVLNLALTLTAPESPRWLISKHNVSAARRALERLMEDSMLADEEVEVLTRSTSQIISESIEQEDRFFSRRTMVPLFLACMVMVFQQSTAINAVLAHSNHMFEDVGFANPRVSTVLIAAGLFVFTIVGAPLIDKLGRKLLLVICALVVALGLFLFSVAAHFSQHHSQSTRNGQMHNLISFTALGTYVVGFSMGWGAIPWVLAGELFTQLQQARALAIVTGVNWIFNFLTVFSYEWLSLAAIIGPADIFLLYGGASLLAALFVALCVPETKGKSLEQISELFQEGNFLIHVAYR